MQDWEFEEERKRALCERCTHYILCQCEKATHIGEIHEMWPNDDGYPCEEFDEREGVIT
jgi:hypothetical protein